MSSASPASALRADGDPFAPAARVRGRLAPEAMFPGADQRYRTRFLRLSTGERVRSVEIGATSGTPILFLGGWGCSAWDFHRMYPVLASAGFRAIAVDLRGHGRSDMPPELDAYTTDAMLAQVVAILDALALARTTVVGHSMGGALATHLAIRHPERVRALGLMSAIGYGTAWPPHAGRLLTPRWSNPLSRVLLRRTVLAVGLRLLYGDDALVDDRNIDEYWAPSQFPGFVPAMRALLHRFRWTPFSSDELASIRVPCLLVRGGVDPIVKCPAQPVMLPPGSREILIERAGHLPHDEASERVNAAMLELLARTS
jgi:pyruvate dehydrogenase E2 component (dihydrolipoamide acetyltransferase)